MSSNNTLQKSLYEVIAQTGEEIVPLGNLTGFGGSPSINDLGFVAFVGRANNNTDLLVENNSGEITNLSVSFPNPISQGVQINNQNQVVARDRLGGVSTVRVWDFKNVGFAKSIGSGAFPANSHDFENILPFPSLNNDNQAVFVATPKGQFPNIALETLDGINLFGKRTYNETLLSTGIARPMIADNGNIVVRNPSSAILLYDYEFNAATIIANQFDGFDYVGLSPGISDDGKIITFYGELNETGAENLGLTPGNGIFASIETGSQTRKITRIAGIAGNGYLDPGETFEDANNNGKVDLGEDLGVITGFSRDERVGIGYDGDDDKNFGTFAYLAFNEDKESLFSSKFEVSLQNEEITHLQSNIVAQVGAQALSISPNLTGVIEDLNIYDPVNNSGQVAFWLKTSTSTEAIVRANPVLKPLLILPGIGGSFPKPSDFKNWLLNRGVAPDTLQIDSILRTYDDLIETLKRAGYVEGVNLFVATYDWRLNPGPIETSIDGKINRSIEELTDDTYEYAVDQLAFWLEEAVKGWRSQFPGIPDDEIPELDSVDIIAHSTGGLVGRTYIQSDGYGQGFSFEDEGGKVIEANLPKVNNFFMLGVPNRGASLAWNPLNNNFLGGAGTLLLKLVSQLALKKLNKGETISLSGRNDLQGVIAPPSDGEKVDPIAFVEQYVPTLRSLLATYPFFTALSDTLDTLRTIESFDPSQRNTLLLDLNNGFDSVAGDGDPNLFADLVEQVSVIYGTNVQTRDAVTATDEPDLETVIIDHPTTPVVDVPKATVLKLNDFFPSVPEGIWYRDEEGDVADIVNDNVNQPGDQTVPLLSAEGTFIDGRYQRQNIDLKPFTQTKKNPDDDEIIANDKPNTDDTVNHGGIVSNIDVQKLILSTLGVSLDENLISTDLEGKFQLPSLTDFGAVIPGVSTFILDPVEGFLVDGEGRRLGYTQATGAVTEIPNSVWLGEEDGIGFFTESVEGPFQLQLTGLGEEYFVSVSLETEAGLGGLEVSGFLAQGEQVNLDIPFNNPPVLDLDGSTDGIDFSTTGTLGATVAIVDADLVIADSDSSNLEGATIAIENPIDGVQEFLSATPLGNITVAYDPTTSTLNLNGSDTLANYQQVLKTVTYNNTAIAPNNLTREISFVVDDGAGVNSLSPVATATLTFLDSTPGKTLLGTPSRDALTGTDGDDIITGFQGRDVITTGGGKDTIVYTSVLDIGDVITDFEVGSDKIALTDVLEGLRYQGSDPLGDGIVGATSRRGETFLQIDPDGFAGDASARLLAQVTGVTEAALNNASNFIF